jgi:hypothetical protein
MILSDVLSDIFLSAKITPVILTDMFSHDLTSVLISSDMIIFVRYTHGGGWSRKINARYLHTLMVYL